MQLISRRIIRLHLSLREIVATVVIPGQRRQPAWVRVCTRLLLWGPGVGQSTHKQQWQSEDTALITLKPQGTREIKLEAKCSLKLNLNSKCGYLSPSWLKATIYNLWILTPSPPAGSPLFSRLFWPLNGKFAYTCNRNFNIFLNVFAITFRVTQTRCKGCYICAQIKALLLCAMFRANLSRKTRLCTIHSRPAPCVTCLADTVAVVVVGLYSRVEVFSF